MLELFKQYNFLLVLVGVTVFSASAGAIGVISVLRRQSLIGDAISHATLPGIVIVFMLLQTKNSFLFLVGAIIAGIFAYLLILLINNNTKIDLDTTLAITLTFFFGLGMMLLSISSKSKNAAQAGIQEYIFGSAATINQMDVIMIVITSIIVLCVYLFLYKEIKIFIFDELQAILSGFEPKIMHIIILISSLIVISVGIQSVGVILVSAMLIGPGVSALQWSKKFHVVVILSAIFGAISGFTGVLLSSYVDKLPTGSTVVFIMSIITVVSILISRLKFKKEK